MTATVRGPTTVRLDLPRGQSLDHGGRTTVWTGTLTPDEKAAVVTALVERGLTVSVWSVDPREGDAEREALHVAPRAGVGQLPTVLCPTCAWLDLSVRGAFTCGAIGWHPRAIAVFDTGKAAADRRACPLKAR